VDLQAGRKEKAMALTEKSEVDKIEIVGPYRAVQVRTASIIERDGEEITRSYHRHVIQAGEDCTNETDVVQAICAAVHTDELAAAYQASLTEQEETND
jgi:hypothetical protein